MDAPNAATAITVTEVLMKALRQELKEWETTFFAAHHRKAGREDIKQHPEIGAKYKKYNELRYPSSKASVSKLATPSRKRHPSTSSHPLPATVTPNKRPKLTHPLHPSTVDPYDPPISTVLSPTAHRTSIGPTPQKDGMVLGLFDHLSSGSHGRTPSKRHPPLGAIEKVQVTPSKRSSLPGGETKLVSTGKRHHRSPLSISRQSYLNTYLTPSVCRIIKDEKTPGSRSGVSKLCFDQTPTFLRRDSQRAPFVDENTSLADDVPWSPIATNKPRKSFAVKGLSALVKGLRDMEEERLDDELDMLREMEDLDASAGSIQQSKVLVSDSQRPDMPLGPDRGCESESDDFANEGKGRDGKPLKVWKKKGQKRTTRKVVMKPNAAKWKPEPAWESGEKSENETEETLINETQIIQQPLRDHGQNSELDDLQSDTEVHGVGKTKRTSTDGGESKIGKIVTKVKKKISSTAHANFRALKIKNKQSKGKRGAKFGRKR